MNVGTRNLQNNRFISKTVKRNALILSFVAILLATLFPFEFLSPIQPESFSTFFQLRPDTPDPIVLDTFLNVLLFIPFGYLLTLLLSSRVRKHTIVWAVLCGLFLSLSIELLQLFLADRFSTILDLTTNTTGTLIGALVYLTFQDKLLKPVADLVLFLKHRMSYKVVSFMAVTYIVLFFFISAWLRTSLMPAQWDATYPLLVGNETTGTKPWQGKVNEFRIYNKALSAGEIQAHLNESSEASQKMANLVCEFDFAEPAYADKVGYLANFISVESIGGEGILPQLWLQNLNAAALAHAINETQQFTLDITFAPDVLRQLPEDRMNGLRPGPARILSYSEGAMSRNFTLGQEGHDLVFRIRTPMTGLNGQSPEFFVHYFFSALTPQRLFLSYDGAQFSVFDNRGNTLYQKPLSAGARFFSFWIPLSSDDLVGYKILYDLALFVPLGLFIALVLKTGRLKLGVALALVLLSATGASVLFEYFRVATSSSTMNPAYISINSLASLGAWSLTRT